MLAIVLLLLAITYFINTRVNTANTIPPPVPVASKPSLKVSAEPSPVVELVPYKPTNYKTGYQEVGVGDCCSGNTCLPFTNGLKVVPAEAGCDMLQFYEHI